ncbi:MAG: hypothetical protein ACKO81_00720, partial [Planctomycetota bacterium]
YPGGITDEAVWSGGAVTIQTGTVRTLAREFFADVYRRSNPDRLVSHRALRDEEATGGSTLA